MTLKKSKKAKNLSWYRKKAWEALSRLTRMKGADANGNVSCVTCGATKHWKEMQAGHWIPQAQGNAVRFDERNVHVQCYRCNINLGGNGPEYAVFMEHTHGREVMDELRALSKTTKKYTKADYQEMRDRWEREIALLELTEQGQELEMGY